MTVQVRPSSPILELSSNGTRLSPAKAVITVRVRAIPPSCCPRLETRAWSNGSRMRVAVKIFACWLELADASVSKTDSFGSTGSSPVRATISCWPEPVDAELLKSSGEIHRGSNPRRETKFSVTSRGSVGTVTGGHLAPHHERG